MAIRTTVIMQDDGLPISGPDTDPACPITSMIQAQVPRIELSIELSNSGRCYIDNFQEESGRLLNVGDDAVGQAIHT